MLHPPHFESAALRLGEPDAGWLPVSIHLGDFLLEVLGSNVLNDPLEELVDLTGFARASRSGFRRACFWMEPSGIALDFRHLRPGLVMLSIFEDSEFVPPMDGYSMTLVHRCLGPQGIFYSAFKAGLAEWAAHAASDARAKWSSRVDQVLSDIAALR